MKHIFYVTVGIVINDNDQDETKTYDDQKAFSLGVKNPVQRNAAVTHCRFWLPFEIRQRYDTKSEKVGTLSSMIWNVLSLSERSPTDREWSERSAKHS
jgi:hypothetical protein